MLSKIEREMLEKLEKEIQQLKTNLDKGVVPPNIKVMGPNEVLPFDVQATILRTTRGFLEEKRKGRNGFREQISMHEHFTRKVLVGLLKEMEELALSLVNTFAAVNDAMTMVHAELDSRDIGKESSDAQLIKDERKRCERFEKFKARFAKKKGKPHGTKGSRSNTT